MTFSCAVPCLLSAGTSGWLRWLAVRADKKTTCTAGPALCAGSTGRECSRHT